MPRELRILAPLSPRTRQQVIRWEENPAAEDLLAAADLCEAIRIFNDERALGARAWKVTEPGVFLRIDKFDETASLMILTPPVMGG